MDEIGQNWRPTADLAELELRSDVLWILRKFFHENGFLEVQTPVLSADTVLDCHIDPISVEGTALGIPHFAHRTFYLQTSPEFGMKRLLSAGMDRIYQIASVFRGGERGCLHNPEFTMVEWYRRGDNMSQSIELLSQLIRSVLPHAQLHTQTYCSAFEEHVGICPLTCSIDEFAKAVQQHQLVPGSHWGEDRDEWLNLIFAELVQPKLGLLQPTVITHYPSSQSALARVCSNDPRVAERYELFIQGTELANGYHELSDAQELMERNRRTNQWRVENGKCILPSESHLQAAMLAGLPDSSGCALGLDRLLMVLSKSEIIDQVLTFPIERA